MRKGGPLGSTASTAASAATSLASSVQSSRAASPTRMADKLLPWHWSADVVAACPSVEDGMTHAEVLERKHHAYVFIEEMRNGIKFQPIVASTAMVLYHRFYHYQSMKQFKWKEMAWCCLFTAFKIEEKVMKMESLLKWSHHVSCKLMKMSREEMERNKLDVKGQQFFEMKERLQFNERVLLQTIGFDMAIKQAGFMVIALVKLLKQRNPIYTSVWGKRVAKVAFDWAGCSAGSELCLMYKPEVVALALLYGAAHDIFGEVVHPSDSQEMWDILEPLIQPGEVDERLLHGIMVQLHTYCHRFKEPRAYWRTKSGGVVPTTDDKGRKIEIIAPPQDPSTYGPNAPKLAQASGIASGSTPTSGLASSSAAPTSVTADPSPNPPRQVGPLAVVASSGTAQPTPPRTTDNTPHVSPASRSPLGPTDVVAVSASAMVVENDHTVSATFQAVVASSSRPEATRPEKRPLALEDVPPGGGDGFMKDDRQSWHEPSAAKRPREGPTN